MRPSFGHTLCIRQGRHPIHEAMLGTREFVPNDTFCNTASSFHIITGANMVEAAMPSHTRSPQLPVRGTLSECGPARSMLSDWMDQSGKSTYLKQVALSQIMAQMGSYIPADFATFRIADKVCVELFTAENALISR